MEHTIERNSVQSERHLIPSGQNFPLDETVKSVCTINITKGGEVLATKEIKVIFSILAISLGGCSKNTTSMPADSWYNDSPSGQSPIVVDAKRLDDQLFQKVKPEMQKKSEMLLKSSSVVKVSNFTASEMIGEKVKSHIGKSPYLVRGIDSVSEDGNFAIYEKKGDLWVMCGSLGSTQSETKRQSLIIFLKSPPKTVFVSYHVVE